MGARRWPVSLQFWVGGNRVLVSAVCGFGVPVEGLIVTVRAEDVVIKQQPEGVAVVPTTSSPGGCCEARSSTRSECSRPLMRWSGASRPS